MNQIFNRYRFSALVKLEWQLNRKKLLIGMGGYVLTVILVMYITLVQADFPDMNELYGLLAAVQWLPGALFTMSFFREPDQKETAVAWLGLPASQFEKILVKWVFTALFFSIFSVVVFQVVSQILIGWAVQPHFTDYRGNTLQISSSGFFDQGLLGLTAVYLVINGMLLCGELYFRKFMFVKVAVIMAVMAYCVAYTFYQSRYDFGLPEKYRYNGNYSYFSFYKGNPVKYELSSGGSFTQPGVEYEIRLPAPVTAIHLVAGLAVMPLLLFMVAYHKTKEKQV